MNGEHKLNQKYKPVSYCKKEATGEDKIYTVDFKQKKVLACSNITAKEIQIFLETVYLFFYYFSNI